MGQLTIPNTSITYNNPKQLDSTAIDPKTGAPWVQAPVPASGTTSWGGCLQYPGPSTPQPGSYDATAPTAPPVLFGKQPPSLTAGGTTIPNTSTVVKNPA